MSWALLMLEDLMHDDFKQDAKDLLKTRGRLVQLHTELYDRMFSIFKDHKLIETRGQLKDAQVRQYCLSHQFDRLTKLELEVIVSQLRQLHDATAKLDAQLSTLRASFQEDRKAIARLGMTKGTSTGLELEGYGAPDLKRSRQKFMAWALGIAGAFHLIVISIYWLAVSLQPPPEKPRTVRVYKYVELGPPPSITETYRSSGVQARPPAGGTMTQIGVLGMLARIVPVDAKNAAKKGTSLLIDDNSLNDLDRLLAQTPFQRGGGAGDGAGGLGGSGQGYGSGPGGGSGFTAADQVILDDFKFEQLSNVDQLIGEDRKIESVKLEKKGQVNIQPPSQMRGSQAAMGQRNAESVMAIINGQQGRIMYAYNKYLKTDPGMGGKVSMDVTIEANGSISKVGVVEATIENEDFIRELMSIIRRLRFDPIPEGSLTVNLPFVFSRVD